MDINQPNAKRIIWLLSERYNIAISEARLTINKDYNKKLIEDHSLSIPTIVDLIANNESLSPRAKYIVFK